jgi:membrane protein
MSTNTQEEEPEKAKERLNMSQPPPGKPPPHSGTPVRRTGQALLDKGNAAIDRAKATRAGAMWARLNAVDFINSAFQFATFAMLCIFPLLVVVAAAAGSDIRKVISTRLGLNPQAAKDVNGLMSSGHQALTSLTVVGIVVLVFSAISIASTLQSWYQKVYDQPPSRDWMRQLVNRLIWWPGS